MSSIELLELAGSAAGLQVTAEYFDDGNIFAMRKNGGGWWNPLNDDGDALRLVVKLDMTLTINRVDGYSSASVGYTAASTYTATEKHGKDMYSATRIAIVKAAAEIGRLL